MPNGPNDTLDLAHCPLHAAANDLLAACKRLHEVNADLLTMLEELAEIIDNAAFDDFSWTCSCLLDKAERLNALIAKAKEGGADDRD